MCENIDSTCKHLSSVFTVICHFMLVVSSTFNRFPIYEHILKDLSYSRTAGLLVYVQGYVFSRSAGNSR